MMPNDPPKIARHLQEVSSFDVERRWRFVDLGKDDLRRIAAIKDLIDKHAEEHAAAFFSYLSKLPEAAEMFARRELLAEARRLKAEHLAAMVAGDYGQRYVEERIRLGMLYSKVRLEGRIFIGAYHAMLSSIGTRIAEHFAKDPLAAFAHFNALEKVGCLDIGVIVDVLMAEREATITRQQEAIRELSTPALQIRDRLLILPIIGLLDSHRARQLTDGLLRAIRAHRAKVVVMDVTGVATVDSKVANHLLQTVAASRLMGANVIVTGLSADVAQSLVILGVDLSKLNAVGDLQGGLEEAERLLGYEVVLRGRNGAAAAPPRNGN
jgi:rsbT co-antagonist protein RsbR